MENKTYVIDKVDDKDFMVGQVLGNIDNLPSSVILKDDEVQDQSVDESTRYGCVFFTGSTISNTMNFFNKEKERVTGKYLCTEAEKRGLLDREKGAYLVSSPKLLKELGYIGSYARARTLQDIKLSLCHNKPLQTGSVLINRNATKENNNIVIKGDSYGHSFTICGYDDEKEVLICENSYGDDYFDKGYFYLKYQDIDLLFQSKYMMTDSVRDIANNRYWKYLKKHIEQGYSPIFDDYSEETTLNAGEVKALIDLAMYKHF